MTPEQKSVFQKSGVLLLAGALSKKQVSPIKEHVLAELKRLQIWSSGKVVSASIRKVPAFQQITKLSKSIEIQDLYSRLVTPDVLAAIGSLADRNVAPAQSQLLISPPHQGEWTLKGLSWHTDVSSSDPHRLAGIQVFVLIDDVQQHGGATLAVAGSHLLPSNAEPGKRLREILRGDGDLEKELSSRGLAIVEMSGKAGDVYLMDMRTLHTPAINSTKHWRIMATLRCFPPESR